ncbi:hypothetical protein DAEQUDRAFT_711677 [Daedalea quercina L-15889]|uniref:Uncharacterized protein n=1 Tax=Daedalea quercina L-15889 TaxID=1314783 RepID=A0A165PUK2_9APHY|nr:hypothetical protein DAEQUDRAFT_711677 [Daedalea quercina L-15889]
MPNPWAPSESAATLFAERSWLQGALLSNIFYGMQFVLFGICLDILSRQLNNTNLKRHMMLIVFLVVVFILSTLFMFSSAVFTERAFIDDRDFPGGPNGYETEMFEIPVDELGNAVFMIGQWVMDLLLVWRCMVIYGTCSKAVQRLVTTLIWLLWLASLALGIVYLIQSRKSSLFSAANFTLASACMSLAINIVVTVLIAGRLLLFRRRIKNVLGSKHVTQYANIAAVLIESASMYTCFLLVFVVTLSVNNPVVNVFTQCVGQVQTVSSFLIIYRIASGSGWTARTGTDILTQADTDAIDLKNLSPMRFRGTDFSTAHESTTIGSNRDLNKSGMLVSKEVLHDQMSNSNV